MQKLYKEEKITKIINGKAYNLTPKQWKVIMDNAYHELEKNNKKEIK